MLWNLEEKLLPDELSIPLSVRIPALVAVGHPAGEALPHGKDDRLDPKEVHYGQ